MLQAASLWEECVTRCLLLCHRGRSCTLQRNARHIQMSSKHFNKSESDTRSMLSELKNPTTVPTYQPESPKIVTVAVVGMPNAGKSTLLNRLVGVKVAAVSPKVQTTRNRILGVITEGNTQVVLFDTPGLVSYHEGRRLRLSRPLLKEARDSVWEADVVLTLVDGALVARKKDDKTRVPIIFDEDGSINQNSKQNILIVNKCDLLAPKDRVSLAICCHKKQPEKLFLDSARAYRENFAANIRTRLEITNFRLVDIYKCTTWGWCR
eukprot:m.45619 g.45619  ORF g.45619 m.45619 type:complete len:265 (-) comp10274_c0_seq2:444-1238(-)